VEFLLVVRSSSWTSGNTWGGVRALVGGKKPPTVLDCFYDLEGRDRLVILETAVSWMLAGLLVPRSE